MVKNINNPFLYSCNVTQAKRHNKTLAKAIGEWSAIV